MVLIIGPYPLSLYGREPLRHSPKHLLLCSTRERKLWVWNDRWVNNDSILIFGWIVPLSLFFFYPLCLLMRCKANVYLHPEVITQNTCSAIEGKKSQDETCCIFWSNAFDRRELGKKWKYLLSVSAFAQMVFLSHSAESLLFQTGG